MNSIMETTCRVCNNVKQISKQGLSFHKLLTALRREFREQNLNLKIERVGYTYTSIQNIKCSRVNIIDV